jgi:hypothetical protein
MAHKKVLFGSAAREKVLQGAEALTEATMTDIPEPERGGMRQSPEM